jgi:hypothetical protein
MYACGVRSLRNHPLFSFARGKDQLGHICGLRCNITVGQRSDATIHAYQHIMTTSRTHLYRFSKLIAAPVALM